MNRRYLNWNQRTKLPALSISVTFIWVSVYSIQTLTIRSPDFCQNTTNGRTQNRLTFQFEDTPLSFEYNTHYIHYVSAFRPWKRCALSKRDSNAKHNKKSDPTTKYKWTFIGHYLNLFPTDINTWLFLVL